MKKYFVHNLENTFERPHEVTANSPLEAVRKIFPDYKVSRDVTNRGNVIVGNWFNGYHGAVFRRYVYYIERGNTR